MRGLPPVPANIARAELVVDTGGTLSSVSSWLFIPGLEAASFTESSNVAGQVRIYLVNLCLNLMSDQGAPTEFRWFVYGSAPYSFSSTIGGLIGSRGDSAPLNASTGIYWSTNARGKSGRCIMHVPAFPTSFTDDRVHLNGDAVDAVRLAAAGYLVGLTTVSDGTLTSCSLVTLHRQAAGAPLPATQFKFIDHGTACPVIAGVQRRLKANR